MVIEAFVLGLAYMLAPGPVLVETVRRSIRGGVRAAAAVQAGALAADVLYAVLFLCGGGQMLLFPWLKFGLSILGAALLVYLGVSMALGSKQVNQRLHATQRQGDTSSLSQQRLVQPFITGLLLLLVNPYSLVFWFSVGSTTFDRSFAGVGGFLLGGAVGCALAALIAGQLRSPRMQQFAGWVWVSCAVMLTTLGVQLGYTTLFAGGIR